MSFVSPVRIEEDNDNVGHEGRVQIRYKDTWGSICNYRWNRRDANVVCRSLGFPGAESAPDYPHGDSGDWVLDQVRCVGTEESLFLCDTTGLGVVSCGKDDDDGGVICATDLEGMIFAFETLSHNLLLISTFAYSMCL